MSKLGGTKILISVLLIFLLLGSREVYSLPEGEEVVEGTATFDHSVADTLKITTSETAIINFNSFDIDVNEYVYFYQPSLTSNVLNNVLGGNTSYISGFLYANGNIYLVNPAGIVFEPSANIDVGGLVASTMRISNADFMNSNFVFYKLDEETGEIINRGTINAGDDSFIALLAETIENDGFIKVNKGKVVLASGKKVTLSFEDDNLIQVVVDEAVDLNPLQLDDAILNTGTIQADSGEIIIQASAVQGIFQNVVNNEGILLANRIVEGEDGTIALLAPEGDIRNTGTMYASGDITVEAQDGKILQLASADVKGANILFVAPDDINLAGTTTAEEEGRVDISSGGNITVAGDVTGLDGASLAFIADNDNSQETYGGGDFIQSSDTTIATYGGGDITIRSGSTALSGTGDVTVRDVSSSGNLDITAYGGEVSQIEGTTLAVVDGELMIDAYAMTLYNIQAHTGHILIGSRRAPVQITGLPHYIHTAGDIDINTVTSDASITTLTTSHGDILRYAARGDLTLEAASGGVMNSSGIALPGDTIKLIGNQIGSIDTPFIVDATLTHIYRNIGDIDIAQVIDLEGDYVTIAGPAESYGAVTYNSLASLTLEAPLGDVTDSGQAIIPADTLTLIGSNIGQAGKPFITDANLTHVVRAQGDIVIALHSIYGLYASLRGPPEDGFGITYNITKSLTLEARDGSIYTLGDTSVQANILSLIASHNIGSSDHELHFKATSLSTITAQNGSIYLNSSNTNIYIRGDISAYSDINVYSEESVIDVRDTNGGTDITIASETGSINLETTTGHIDVHATVSAPLGTLRFWTSTHMNFIGATLISLDGSYIWNPEDGESYDWTGAVSNLWNVAGNWDSGGVGTYPGDGSSTDDTVLINKAGGSTVQMNLANVTIGELVISVWAGGNGTHTLTLGGNLTVDDNASATSGNLDILHNGVLDAVSYTINMKAGMFRKWGTFTYDTSEVIFTGTGEAYAAVTWLEFYDLTVASAAAAAWWNAGSVKVHNKLEVDNGGFLRRKVGGTQTIYMVDSASVVNNGEIDINVLILETNIHDMGGGDYATTNITIQTATTVTLTGAVTDSGNITIGAGCTLIQGDNILTSGGNWSNASTFTPDDDKNVVFTGSGKTINSGGTGAGKTFKNVTINSAGTVSLLTNNLTQDAGGVLTMTAGTLDLSTLTWTLGADLSTTAGTIAIGTGTLAGGTTYDVTVGNGATFTQGTGTLSAVDLSITGTAVYTCSGASVINVAGNTDITAAGWTPSSSIITMGGDGKYVNASVNLGSLVNNGGIDGSRNYIKTSNLVLDGTFTNNAGKYFTTLDGANSRNLTTGGTFSNAGNFYANNSTITMTENVNFAPTGAFDNGTSTVVLDGSGTVTVTGSTTFFNLTSTAAGTTFEFNNTATQTVAGALTLTGISGSLILLRSDTGGQQWSLNNSGTNAVSYVDVQDSDASSGNAIDATNNCTNSGNNLNWTFPAVVSDGVSARIRLQASEILSYMSHSDETEDEKRKRKRLYIQITALIDTSNLILKNPYDFSISPYIVYSDI